MTYLNRKMPTFQYNTIAVLLMLDGYWVHCIVIKEFIFLIDSYMHTQCMKTWKFSRKHFQLLKSLSMNEKTTTQKKNLFGMPLGGEECDCCHEFVNIFLSICSSPPDKLSTNFYIIFEFRISNWIWISNDKPHKYFVIFLDFFE